MLRTRFGRARDRAAFYHPERCLTFAGSMGPSLRQLVGTPGHPPAPAPLGHNVVIMARSAWARPSWPRLWATPQPAAASTSSTATAWRRNHEQHQPQRPDDRRRRAPVHRQRHASVQLPHRGEQPVPGRRGPAGHVRRHRRFKAKPRASPNRGSGVRGHLSPGVGLVVWGRPATGICDPATSLGTGPLPGPVDDESLDEEG